MIGSLFSGVGGLELGLEHATGLRPAWVCERDKDASVVLAQRFGVPNLGDITAVRWEDVEPVDLLCGGPPCQPTSSAGKRLGEADDRWMWPAALDAVRRIRPRRVLFENPPSLLTLDRGRPFGRILGALAQMGYVGRYGCLRASEMGAPHGRERVFLFAAHAQDVGPVRSGPTRRWRNGPTDDGGSLTDSDRGRQQVGPQLDGETVAYPADGHPRRGHLDGRRFVVADPDSPRLEGRADAVLGGADATVTGPGRAIRSLLDGDVARAVAWETYEPAIRRWEAIHGPTPAPVDDRGRLSPSFVEWMMGFPPGWVTDMPISRSAQLRCLGNAVVPQAASAAWHLLDETVRAA